jgi:RNA polymerase sigma factor (TIGR02999 family)
MSDVTEILHLIAQGQKGKTQQLLPLVYDELRQLAANWLASENPGQTLQPTALVHEAFLRLVNDGAEMKWESKGHFFAAAATAMRRILIDNARRKKQIKNGGHLQRAFLESIEIGVSIHQLDLLSLDEALSEFESEHPDKAEIVRLRFFAGLTHDSIAKLLGISVITVKRHWRFARVWLYQKLND